ncbi:MAG: SDR family NAD(P)-dependent oxidoreductase [Armatimonadota bacterium]
MSVETAFDGARVIVTGGAGFIGSHLAEVLAGSGARVTVIDSLESGNAANVSGVDGLHFEALDIADREAVANVIRAFDPQYVFHFAANASVPRSVEDPDHDFDANVVGTYNVFRACRRIEGLRKVVFASSAAVYGEPSELPIRETTPLRPISPYGFSKLASEQVLHCHRDVYGVPAVAARIFNAYGPRMARFVILDFLRKLAGDPKALTVLGSGRQVREFIYVRDAVSAFLHLAVSGEPGDAYNVSGGKPISILELAERLIAARGLTGRCTVLTTGESWVGDAQQWMTDTAKLRGLGFTPSWSLDDGIAQTIAWFDREIAR